MYKQNKAISPVIAVSLLIVVTVVGVLAYQNWFVSYQSSLQSDISAKSDETGKINIETIVGSTLYVSNSGTQNDSFNSISVNGIDCSVNQQVEPGVSSIDISYCLQDSGNNQIIIVTDSSVIKETIYLEEVSTPSIDCSSLTIGGEWIKVPKDDYFVTKDFCVMKYEARNISNIATSEPLSVPWGGNNYTNAYTFCSNLGPGFHLITNREWMTIARNIENTPSSWTGGSVGNGILYTGNLGINTISSYDFNGGNIDNGSSRDTKARLILDNGEEIWDFSGNALEWVDANENGTTRTSGDACGAAPARPEEYDQCSFTSPFSKNSAVDKRFEIGPLGNYNSSHGTGGIYDYHNNEDDTVFIRGGTRWNSLEDGGIYWIALDYYKTDGGNDEYGFRCTYNP